MRIWILALDDLFDTGLASVLDTFGFADHLAAELGGGAPRFHVRTVGLRRRVRTHRGLIVATEPLRGPRPDALLVPALYAEAPAGLDDALARSDVADACAALIDEARAGVTLTAACTGTFVLAQSTLLDGRRATTTWWLAPAFRERFPRVQLDESRMIVDEKTAVTAGAALAHVDLALWLVRQLSPTLAGLTARFLTVDARPSQAPFIVPDHLAHADPVLERFERWVRRHVGEPFVLAQAARAVGVSQRSLHRHVQRVLGRSPVSFVQDLRVELAVHLLSTSDESVEAIAARVGYRDGATLRTLLKRKLGRGVKAIRQSGGASSTA
jgi:transcriptional regulator GlxA family with amidase domain